MKRFLIAAAASLSLAACTPPQTAEDTNAAAEITADAPYIAAAVADERRPEEERTRDQFRRPAEMVAFAEIEPGDRVADLLPGAGYFTRIFAVAVGEEGRVYPVIRPDGVAGEYETPILAVADEYENVTMARAPYDALSFPEPLDVVFTAQNYHDMAIVDYNLGDRAEMNRTAFEALAPGGLYVVIDHAAADGHPLETDGETALHRIDQALVRQEVEAAGFIYEGELDVLRNAEDDRSTNVFDEAIRGRTDQFVMRFRKPVT